MASQHEKDAQIERQARRDLNRLSAEADTIGTSASARMATKIESRFKADDINPDDKVELWGARIGRALGLIFAIGIVLYLIIAYVFN